MSYPLALLTVPFALVLLYWLFVVLGALDIDLFHGAEAAGAGADGVLEGASKGVLEGASKGVLEGASKGVLEGAAKGALEGAGKGVIEGAAKAAIEGASEAAADGVAELVGPDTLEVGDGVGVGATDAASLSAFAALRAVPATVSLSVWIALSWLLCATGAQWLLDSLQGLVFGLAATGLLLGSLLLAMPPTAWIIRPLARLFVTRHAKGHRDLVGRVCVVSTGTVDERFGQAALEDGSLSLLLQVRAEPGQRLRKGDRILIVQWNPALEAFSVEPLDPMLAEAAESSVASSRSPASSQSLGDDPFDGTTESPEPQRVERS